MPRVAPDVMLTWAEKSVLLFKNHVTNTQYNHLSLTLLMTVFSNLFCYTVCVFIFFKKKKVRKSP